MIRSILDQLFDLGPIPEDASGLEIGWSIPFPGWVWFLIIIIALIFSFWSYSRLIGPRWLRGLLASTRTLLILLLVALISGPEIHFPREDVEEDVVIVLVDRSASMQIMDASVEDERLSRDRQLASIIDRNPDTWSRINERSDLRWIGFSSGSFPITSDESGRPDLGEPDGWRTDIGSSMRQSVDGASSRPISGLVVFSDGQSSTPPNRTLLKRLQQESIPVFPVPMGSPEPMRDASIKDVTAPGTAFIRDSIPVLVEIETRGLEDGDPIRIQVSDKETGEIFDSQTTEVDGGSLELMLDANLNQPGDRKLVIEVESPGGDLIEDNDLLELSVDVVDRPIRVLYIEGYPRWEYRYLKNILVREQSIESSVMLISADREFAQEGNTPISRLPRTEEEFEEFDLIIIGDVPAGFFSPEQIRLMKKQVADRGTGLFWLSGSRYNPGTWAGTDLDDLLPIRSPLDLGRSPEPVVVDPTTLSRQLGVLVLDPDEPSGWRESLSRHSTGWSRLHSLQLIEDAQVKPTTEVLAFGVTESGVSHPLLLSMRFGSGQVLFSAVDDIWRWRFGLGETLTERWWVGLVRMLARQALDNSGRDFILQVEPDDLVPGSAARIQLIVQNEELSESLGETVTLDISSDDESYDTEVELIRQGESPEWAADWFPDDVGRFRFELTDTNLSVRSRSDPIPFVDVVQPDDEFRNPDTNHELLSDIAATTGGRVLTPDSIDNLPSLLPNREVLVQNPIVVPIWNSGTMFLLLLGLFTFEWMGRRLIRMI